MTEYSDDGYLADDKYPAAIVDFKQIFFFSGMRGLKKQNVQKTINIFTAINLQSNAFVSSKLSAYMRSP